MKPILDACCGGKMFYFDKNDPRVLFQDIRKEETTLCDGRKFEVKPDVVGDFTSMRFPDNTFNMVVFDPPHLRWWGGAKTRRNSPPVSKESSMAHCALIGVRPWPRVLQNVSASCVREVFLSSSGTKPTLRCPKC